MIEFVATSIFEAPSQTLVNPVNCVGVMGAGLALEFKRRYPAMFDAYRRNCASGLLDVGSLQLHKSPEKWVLNFPTKRHWRDPSRLEWIDAGLAKFVATYAARGIESVSLPMLGCGLGGLRWDDVRPLMERHIGALPIRVLVHEYR